MQINDWELQREFTPVNTDTTVTIYHSQEGGAWRVKVNGRAVGCEWYDPRDGLMAFWSAVDAAIAAFD